MVQMVALILLILRVSLEFGSGILIDCNVKEGEHIHD